MLPLHEFKFVVHIWESVKDFNPLPHRDTFTLLQTERTQIRQLLLELSDQGLLCTLVDLTSNFFVLYTNMKVFLYNY